VQRALAGRPLLMVIDDVWEQAHLDVLRQVIAPGCAQLITTRNTDIARAFAGPDSIMVLEELSEKDSVDLLAYLVAEVGQDNSGFVSDSSSVPPPDAAVGQPTVPREALRPLALVTGGLPLSLQLMGAYIAERVTFATDVPAALEALRNIQVRLSLKDREQQRTLEEIIGLSVEAPPDDISRHAFAAMASFAPKSASFSLEAATIVADVGGERLYAKTLEQVFGYLTCRHTVAVLVSGSWS
nr:NB-ARC domain-containing protein [Chloroflexota bacterium]